MSTPHPAEPGGTEPPRRVSATSDRSRWLALALLSLLAVVGMFVGFDRASAPFGNSDEGLNSSVWAMCSRSLRADPLGSALGGQRLDGVDYATHPPLTCATAALMESIFGENEWATRAPAWLASLSLIPLTYILLRRLDLAPLMAASGTFVGIGSPMVITYGSMLDTPMVALPIAVLVAIALAGEARGAATDRAWSPAAVGVVSALAGLAAWQTGLFALFAGLATWRWGRAPRRGAPYVGGAGLGLFLSIGWGVWSHGSLEALRGKLASRSTGDARIFESLGFQFDWLTILLGIGLLGAVGAVAAVADPKIRPVIVPALLATAAWSLGFHGGAAGHQYWNYFIVLPVAIGSGWGLAHLAAAVDRHPATTISGSVVAVVLALVVSMLGILVPNQASEAIDEGHPTGSLLRSSNLSAVATLPIVGDDDRIWSIVVYYTDLDTRPIDRRELEDLSQRDPSAEVLIALPCPDGRPTVCDDLPEADRQQDRLTTAGEVVDILLPRPDAPG